MWSESSPQLGSNLGGEVGSSDLWTVAPLTAIVSPVQGREGVCQPPKD